MKNAYLRLLLLALGLLATRLPAALAQCTPTVVTTFPYVENFDGVTTPALPCGVTVVDANNDNSKWVNTTSIPSSSPNVMYYVYNRNNAADDWFFTPGLRMRAGYRYQLQFKYRAGADTFTEKLEVKLGTAATPAGQTTATLFSNPGFTSQTYLTTTPGTATGQVATFSPPATGTYYVGFHTISAPDQINLYVDDVSVTEAAPLPVQLVSFEAQGSSAAVRLTWATATEANSARFEVERSLDGVAFAKIGDVAAADTSLSARAYAWLDAAAPVTSAPLYYHLRQVDLDGTAAYSPVRSVALATGTAVVFYPNPTTGLTTFVCPAATTLTLLDALGRACRVLPLPAGPSAVDLSALPAGIYTLTGAATARPLRLVKE